MDKIEYRAVIKFLTKEGNTPEQINDRLRAVYGDSAPSYATVKNWAKLFKWGRESLQDDPRPGRPIEATAPDIVAKIDKFVHDEPRIGKRMLADIVNISPSSVLNILHDELGMKKYCCRWIPRTLTTENKRERVAAAHEFLDLLKWNERDVFDRIVTGDETWIYYYDPPIKQQSMEWRKRTQKPSETAQHEKSAMKVMAAVFWDVRGIILVEFLPANTTVTGNYYAQQMHRLRDAIKEKRRGLLGREVILLHDNAPPHKSLVAQAAVRDCGFAQLHHPPYSPDLAPSDYFLFPNTKRYLKGKRFESAEDIMSNIWEVWEGKDEQWFRGGIEALKHRYENVIGVRGDHFEQ